MSSQVLHDAEKKDILNVRAALKKAEIIPTVIDDFLPYLSLNVTWPSCKTADLGNIIKPDYAQKIPSIELRDDATSSDTSATSSDLTYTVALTDPDAPSRDDPKWSEFCHWIITNVPLTRTGHFTAADVSGTANAGSVEAATQTMAKGLKEVIEYKPPGPPPKTGKHRYVFLAFAPANSTSEPLNLTKPSERRHWGFGKQGKGVREWAEQNSLVPVAANFIYAQNDKQ